MDLETSTNSTRAWLAVYPLKVETIKDIPSLKIEYDESQFTTCEEWAYRLYSFEVGVEYIENDWDVSEDEMLSHQGKVVFGFEALEYELAERGLESNQLVEPWKTDYPL